MATKKIDYFGQNDTKKTTFRGNPVTLIKIPMRVSLQLQELSEKGELGEAEMNVKSLAIMVANGVKEFGQAMVPEIEGAGMEFLADIDAIAKEIMSFNNLKLEDDMEDPKA